jgi:hypothetical protein
MMATFEEVKLFPGSVGHLLGRRPLCPQALSFDGHSLMHRRVGRKRRLQYYLIACIHSLAIWNNC